MDDRHRHSLACALVPLSRFVPARPAASIVVPMCANYTPVGPERLRRFFGVGVSRDHWVAEAYPGHVAPIVCAGGGDPEPRVGRLAVFGLIPPWSRDGRDARRCYNARTETVAEKPSFRHAWRARQWCVVPAEAIFEPRHEDGRAVRWRIVSADRSPLAIAGMWEAWRSPGGQMVGSFTMLTINADGHPMMGAFHAPGEEKRSVVLLAADEVDAWLGADPGQARALLRAFEGSRVRTEPAPRPPTGPQPVA
jgi:putative SOS response-associated peptidase YedK